MTQSIHILYKHYQNFPRICTDSRSPIKGSIFFALSGPSFNGNKFAAQALAGGCEFAVIDDIAYQVDERYILVKDTLLSLQQLANFHRNQLKTRIIAITGSNGKTTSKELLRNVLQKKFNTYATRGNLNNHIGVPLTLLELSKETEIAIIEMGASKQGDIKELVDIAEPDFGLITNIGKAHLEGMGGIEGVIKTKTELYDFIRSRNLQVFVNTLHSVFTQKAEGISQITYGENQSDDVIGYFHSSDPFVKFSWKSNKNETSENDLPIISSKLIGRYNYENLLAAACVGNFFGVSTSDINQALEEYTPDNNRSQIVTTSSNKIILDAYNANPTSMKEALSNFKDMNHPSKMVILGQMNELGDVSQIEHQILTEAVMRFDFQTIVLIGEPYRPFAKGQNIHHFGSTNDAESWLKDQTFENKLILIKGSRSNKLEKLVEAFV
jgi:UDP-N-acetylmuramoyl-tripeptide--D-alanyl-D-alanine ligase